METNTREGDSRKEYGLLFGAVLNYDQHLMESIWDWHHQELQKTRTAEQERVVGILQNMKGVYSARDVIEKATEAISGNERKV